MCRVTGVPFNTVAWKKKKKKKGFMAFLLWRAEETEVTLDLKTSLNLEHSWQMTTYMVLTAASIVLLTHFFWKSLITLKVLVAKSEMALNVKQTQIFSFTMLGYIKGPGSLIIWDHYSKKITPPCVITVLHQFLIAYKWAGL